MENYDTVDFVILYCLIILLVVGGAAGLLRWEIEQAKNEIIEEIKKSAAPQHRNAARPLEREEES